MVKKYIIKPSIYKQEYFVYDEFYNKVHNTISVSDKDIVVIKIELLDIDDVIHLYNYKDYGKICLYYEGQDIPNSIFEMNDNFEATINLSGFKYGIYYIKVFVYNKINKNVFSSSEIKMKVGR